MIDLTIGEQESYYRKAQLEFERLYGDFPIKTYRWRLKEEQL